MSNIRVRRFALVFALLALFLTVAVHALEDGVYEKDEKGDLDKRVVLRVTGGHLSSSDNANEHWHVTVRYPQTDFKIGTHYLVVLDGTIFTITGWGELATGEYDFNLALSPRFVPAAQKLFGLAPISHRHPGHKIDATFSTAKSSYAPGEKIVVKMTLKNVGDRPFYFDLGGHNRGARDNQFSFSGMKLGADEALSIKTVQDFGGLSLIKELAPGEELTHEVDLSLWIDLSKPGYYELLGSFLLPIYGGPNHQADNFEVWKDYVTRAFRFNIEEPK